jgi:hypothetical protein
MPGNTLGSRGTYTYTDDFDSEYLYTTDVDLATAVGATPATNAELPSLPSRFRPRGVYWEADTGERKFIIVPNIASSAWADASQTVTIDGLQGKTSGRRGERQSYLRLTAAPTPDPTPGP